MNDYTAVSAKLRSMFGRHLTMQNYEQLLNQPSVSDICLYLKNETDYADVFTDLAPEDMHRETIEQRLWQKLLDEYSRLMGFLDEKRQKLLAFWFSRREITFLQDCLQSILYHIPRRDPLLEEEHSLSPFASIDMARCRDAQSLSALADACSGTPYAELLHRADKSGADYFTLALTLDGLYFKQLLDYSASAFSKKEHAALKSLVGTRCDLLNIMWIYRGRKHFSLDPALIYTYLIPVRYKLSTGQIRSMVESGTPEAIGASLADTPYADFFSGVGNGYFIEENYRRRLYQNAKQCFRQHGNSMAALFSYLYLKEFEILTITQTIECVRYSLSRESVLHHIQVSREMK